MKTTIKLQMMAHESVFKTTQSKYLYNFQNFYIIKY